jgi:hypothetical protein
MCHIQHIAKYDMHSNFFQTMQVSCWTYRRTEQSLKYFLSFKGYHLTQSPIFERLTYFSPNVTTLKYAVQEMLK